MGSEGRGVRGRHASVVVMDEAQEMPDVGDPEALLEAAARGLSRHTRGKPAPLEPCPLCAGSGYGFTPLSKLWGHNCWGCAGWGAVPRGTTGMRGPFAPQPRRQT